MAWGKWTGVAAMGLSPGRMEGVGWGGGTGHDGKGQSSWAHSTLNVRLRGPQIEGSIGGWKTDDGNTKRAIIIINNSNHWCL